MKSKFTPTRESFVGGAFDTGVIAERQRIMAIIERLAQPTADKQMTIDRVELLKAILNET